MTIALLDADVIAFKAACVSTDTVKWGNGVSQVSNLPQAKSVTDHIIRKWREKSGLQGYVCCLSVGTNFRKIVDPNYKAQRKNDNRPTILDDVRQHIMDHHPFVTEPGLEADDLMGIRSTDPAYKGQAVIVSIDKDMQSIPGRFLNPDKASRPLIITKSRADYFWMMQTLTGDPVDGYKGCPGIGPKRAENALRGGDYWSQTLALFHAAGLTEDDAVLQARLARILRYQDWNPTTKEITLWHPTRSTILSTTTLDASRSSRSSSKPAESTPATKPLSSATSSSTSVALPSKGRKRKTSRKRTGTSTGSSSLFKDETK